MNDDELASPQCAQRGALAVIERLRGMPPDQILATWKGDAAELAADEARQVIDEVRHRTGVGLQALNAALKEARARAAASHVKALLRERIGNRRMVLFEPENRTRHALDVESDIVTRATEGSYVSFGGVLSEVAIKMLPYTHQLDNNELDPPSIPQISPLDQVAVLSRVEDVAVFYVDGKFGPKPIAVPQMIVEILLKKKQHKAPPITGLVTHPIVLPGDGSILATNGLHEKSGLFLWGVSSDEARPYSHAEAVCALGNLRTHFLEGFEFASELDADVALAGLFTGVMRRVLDMAPGLAALASTQSSGKTTLARRLHVILTGQDMPVSSFPEGDEPEMQKRLLSALLRSPAMLCFDNIMDGLTFRSPALATAMTGATFSQRVLGVSRDADPPTNVLFVITGNNLSLGADEVTRWLITRLAPKSPNPEERQFEHPDVVPHALSIRDAVLRDVVGMIAGYLQSGATMKSATRFVNWDRVVRQPLMWAGACDMAEAFRANAESSEDVQAHMALLGSLHDIFFKNEFFASDVALSMKGHRRGVRKFYETSGDQLEAAETAESQELWRDAEERLSSALSNLRAKDVESELSVGRVLKAKVGRVAFIDGEGTRLAKLVSRTVRGRQCYRVELEP